MCPLTLPAITGPVGDLLTNPGDIAESFAQYYAELYTPAEKSTVEQIHCFLEDIPPQRFTDTARDSLDSPLTTEELVEALSSLNSGKAPGPNGFPSEFYTRYGTKLGPHLLKVIEEARDLGRLPQDWRHAEITVFLKPRRPPKCHSSYRPISLINVEATILAKALANRLAPFITSVVHPDQAGFMPHRAT